MDQPRPNPRPLSPIEPALERPPADLIGAWTGHALVRRDGAEHQTVQVNLAISTTGWTHGTVGGAVLDALLSRRRGLFGRWFLSKPTYEVRGHLEGRVVPSAGPLVAEITMVLQQQGDHIAASFALAANRLRGESEVIETVESTRLEKNR